MKMRDTYPLDPVLKRLGLTRQAVLDITGKYPTNTAALHRAEHELKREKEEAQENG